MHRLVAALVIALLGIAVAVTGASADGAGSPGGCDGGPSVSGDSYSAPDGYVVDGVCIKSGQIHTDVLTGDDGCYNVDGIGEQTVTVTKDFSGPECQDVSHLDIILSTCGSECDPQDPCEGDECPEDPCEGDECPEDPCEVDPESCVPLELVCVDGNLVEAPANQATNDCGFINVCIGDEVERISEFDAEQQGFEEGECLREDPPEDPGEPEVEEPVEEVAAVQDVAPIEEVAALPAAGLGDGSNGTSFLWVALFGTLLAGLGASTVVAARSRR